MQRNKLLEKNEKVLNSQCFHFYIVYRKQAKDVIVHLSSVGRVGRSQCRQKTSLKVIWKSRCVGTFVTSAETWSRETSLRKLDHFVLDVVYFRDLQLSLLSTKTNGKTWKGFRKVKEHSKQPKCLKMQSEISLRSKRRLIIVSTKMVIRTEGLGVEGLHVNKSTPSTNKSTNKSNVSGLNVGFLYQVRWCCFVLSNLKSSSDLLYIVDKEQRSDRREGSYQWEIYIMFNRLGKVARDAKHIEGSKIPYKGLSMNGTGSFFVFLDELKMGRHRRRERWRVQRFGQDWGAERNRGHCRPGVTLHQWTVRKYGRNRGCLDTWKQKKTVGTFLKTGLVKTKDFLARALDYTLPILSKNLCILTARLVMISFICVIGKYLHVLVVKDLSWSIVFCRSGMFKVKVIYKISHRNLGNALVFCGNCNLLKFLKLNLTCWYSNSKQTSGSFVCVISFMILSVISILRVSFFYILISCLHNKSFYFLEIQYLDFRTHTRTHTCTQFSFTLVKFMTDNISKSKSNFHKLGKFNKRCRNYRQDLNLIGGRMLRRDGLLILLGGDIEVNPGPNVNLKAHNLMLLTQNCRGLNDYAKLKQLMRDKNRILKGSNNRYILALQETYLIDETSLRWHCNNSNYVFTKAESIHSAGCITFLPESVKVIESHDIDDHGHGHLMVIEGLNETVTIVGNIYAPVRSLDASQENFYETLVKQIEELEMRYMYHEPELILLGDFNLPFEVAMNKNRKAQYS
jgi:hypothetical protein